MEWYTKIEAVDRETGEIIPRTWVKKKNYIVINRKTIKSETNGNKRIKTIRWECEKSRQFQIF